MTTISKIKQARKRLTILGVLIIALCLMPNNGHSESLKSVEQEIIQLAADASPSVVSIHSHRTKSEPGQTLSTENTSVIFSGVFISAEGHIVTVAHKLSLLEHIHIVDSIGTKHIATLIGQDRASNIALLKIDSTVENFMPLTEPAKVQTGSFAMSISSPFGLRTSIDTGIISYRNRILYGKRYIQGTLMQTTIPMNTGDEGGLLLNSDGQMIGILTSPYKYKKAQIATVSPEDIKELDSLRKDIRGLIKELANQPVDPEPINQELHDKFHNYNLLLNKTRVSQGYMHSNMLQGLEKSQNVNFAIPSSTIIAITNALKQNGKVQQAWMGIRAKELSAKTMQLHTISGGIEIAHIYNDSPASKATLQTGDIILDIGGKPITNILSVWNIMLTIHPDDDVTLKLLRDGKQIEKNIIFTAKPTK